MFSVMFLHGAYRLWNVVTWNGCSLIPGLLSVLFIISLLIQGLPLETFVVAFKYGAVVVFNPAAKDTAPKEKEVMEMCKPLIKNPVKKGFSEGAP